MKIAFKDAVESIYRFKRWLKGRSWPAARGSAVWYKLKKKVSKDEEDERKMRADKRRREDIREETMAVTGIGKIAETETNPEGEITTGDPYIEGEILRKSHAILTLFTHPGQTKYFFVFFVPVVPFQSCSPVYRYVCHFSNAVLVPV
jgi:hypothetical protein